VGQDGVMYDRREANPKGMLGLTALLSNQQHGRVRHRGVLVACDALAAVVIGPVQGRQSGQPHALTDMEMEMVAAVVHTTRVQ
jgi:hypothetical protein